MNRNDFVRELSNIVGTKKEARDVLEKFITLIKKSLINDERVTISGFGSFYMQLRKAKKGRNPKTGKEVEIPSRKVVKFKPAKDFFQV
mgnify:CR=1 FL=1